MSFYELTKTERANLVATIHETLINAFENEYLLDIKKLFSDEDTYIRKSAYIETGKIFNTHNNLCSSIITILNKLLDEVDFRIRQTVINTAGEIGKTNFGIVEHFFDKGLSDHHHSPRNAVIGSIKKMGEKNHEPIIQWSNKYLNHPDKEIRREICHGLELRGRTHPQDILPLLKQLQFDKTARVRKTLVHVIGQIAYKKNCLATVVKELNTWENKVLVSQCWLEILIIHERYKNFAVLTVEEASNFINNNAV